jgi:large subunit ribosomal protein L9
MEILLREDIDNLGNRGEVVRVRRGYGRNYLLPRGLAVEATSSNVRQIEFERSVLAKREIREKKAAQDAQQGFEGIRLEFERRVSDEGKLFGSVTSHDVVHALEAMGKPVERHRVRLKDHIKSLGEHPVQVRLHRDVVVEVMVVVKPEGGELPAPAQVAAEPTVEAVAPAESRDDEYDEYDEYDE